MPSRHLTPIQENKPIELAVELHIGLTASYSNNNPALCLQPLISFVTAYGGTALHDPMTTHDMLINLSLRGGGRGDESLSTTLDRRVNLACAYDTTC